MVEASANLVNWQPIWTNTVSGASADFVDPEWVNHLRCFGLKAPGRSDIYQMSMERVREWPLDTALEQTGTPLEFWRTVRAMERAKARQRQLEQRQR